jgi:predicted exporter
VTLRRWLPVVVGTLVLAVLAFYVQAKLVVRSDITDFLPEGRDRRSSELLRELAESELARTMILTVGAPDAGAAGRGAKALGEELASNPDIAWVRSGATEGIQNAAHDIYFSRRAYFASDSPAEGMPARLSDEGLRKSVLALKQALGGPLGPLVRALAPGDPLLLFLAQMDRLRAAQDDSLHLEDGQLVTADGRHGVVFLGTRASPFDSQTQARVLGAIDAAFARVNRGAGGGLELESTGVNRFNLAAQQSISDDIQRVSVVSTVGIVVLFLLIFHSIRYVALGMVPLIAGTICAMAAGLALFGSIHGLTLVFGSSLIGVGIDYAEHYFVHYTVSRDGADPETSLLRIWPGLVLGAITTVAGLVGLAWASFPGLREMAVFSTVGVVAALLSTRWFLPPFMPRKPKPVRLQQKLAVVLGRAMVAMMGSRRTVLLLPLAGLLVCAVGAPRVHWIDDVSALIAVDPRLAAEDIRVQGRVQKADPGRFVAVVGKDDEEALAKNDEVARRLGLAVGAGDLETFQSAHELIWSADLQRRSHEMFTQDPTLPSRFEAALKAEGFVASAFRPLDESYGAPGPGPLTLEALQKSPLVDLVRPFRVALGHEVALVTTLGGVRDLRTISARLGDLPDVFVLDQRAFLQDAYGRIRTRTLEMIAVGLVVVFLIVHVRYRKVRLSLAAFLPAVLAVATTLALLAIRGTPLNLMHLVGVLMVLSMGADYAIFVVESRDHPEELGATLVSLIVAMLSTVLSFGLLGMSANPALAALGITAGLGTLLSVVFAPAALILLRDRPTS